MTEQKIEPALTAEEWETAVLADYDGLVFVGDKRYHTAASVEHPDALIALLNAALPDTDPRKITRETVDMLRRAAFSVPDGWSPNLNLANLADALESYLPPEP